MVNIVLPPDHSQLPAEEVGLEFRTRIQGADGQDDRLVTRYDHR